MAVAEVEVKLRLPTYEDYSKLVSVLETYYSGSKLQQNLLVQTSGVNRESKRLRLRRLRAYDAKQSDGFPLVEPRTAYEGGDRLIVSDVQYDQCVLTLKERADIGKVGVASCIEYESAVPIEDDLKEAFTRYDASGDKDAFVSVLQHASLANEPAIERLRTQSQASTMPRMVALGHFMNLRREYRDVPACTGFAGRSYLIELDATDFTAVGGCIDYELEIEVQADHADAVRTAMYVACVFIYSTFFLQGQDDCAVTWRTSRLRHIVSVCHSVWCVGRASSKKPVSPMIKPSRPNRDASDPILTTDR